MNSNPSTQGGDTMSLPLPTRMPPKSGIDVYLTYKSGRVEQKHFGKEGSEKFRNHMSDYRAAKEIGSIIRIELVRAE